MPIREFTCKEHGTFESYVSLKITESKPCPKCGKKSAIVEFSIPAKRNPEHGIVS